MNNHLMIELNACLKQAQWKCVRLASEAYKLKCVRVVPVSSRCDVHVEIHESNALISGGDQFRRVKVQAVNR